MHAWRYAARPKLCSTWQSWRFPLTLRRVLQADDDVANCVQCHPHLPVLATSGIDHAIKVSWSMRALAGPCKCGLHLPRIA